MAIERDFASNRQATALDLAAMRALQTPDINDFSEVTTSLRALTAFAWRSLGARAAINPSLLGSLGRAVTDMRTDRPAFR